MCRWIITIPQNAAGKTEAIQDRSGAGVEVFVGHQCTVRLIRAENVPGHSGILVEARLDQKDGMPVDSLVDAERSVGVQFEEMLVSPDAEGLVRLWC